MSRTGEVSAFCVVNGERQLWCTSQIFVDFLLCMTATKYKELVTIKTSVCFPD